MHCTSDIRKPGIIHVMMFRRLLAMLILFLDVNIKLLPVHLRIRNNTDDCQVL